uniref:EamA domain-containing protein n=1 Tax=Octactis speculum TaxID=3111310 RepID=A0A7S2AX22_9STRA|mmetsp:Transcript_17021/g.22883  ORF Transcript_17021/g.22883 Transcript_17021/m.22883 type:complete len:225 (+) Transcript_17021:290-964(+)
MSLCAPFLAFDPVTQFLVGVCVIPKACSLFNIGCSELGSAIPLYHILSVLSIAAGAFVLGTARPAGGAAAEKSSDIAYWGPLPVGSWIILFNCLVYGFTFRLDKAAVLGAGVPMYYMFQRLVMGCTTLTGARAAGHLTRSVLNRFLRPRLAMLLVGICVADAVYMLSLYKAVSLISPVYVTAIKRGGGVLVSSLVGAVLFNERIRGRELPIATICIATILLCLK